LAPVKLGEEVHGHTAPRLTSNGVICSVRCRRVTLIAAAVFMRRDLVGGGEAPGGPRNPMDYPLPLLINAS
jgi:hypothetical protein